MSDAANQPGYYRKLATILLDSRDRLRHPGFMLGTQDGGVVAFRLGRLVEPGFRSRERRGALGVQSSPRQTRGASA